MLRGSRNRTLFLIESITDNGYNKHRLHGIMEETNE